MPADTGAPWNIPYPVSTDSPDDPNQSQARSEKVALHLTTLTNTAATLNKRQLWSTASTVTWTASATSAPTTVTIPAGIFSGTPSVVCQCTGAYYPTFRTHGVGTATSVTYSALLGSVVTTSMPVSVIAAYYSATMELLESEDPGPPADDPEYGSPLQVELVCRNRGCESEGSAVTTWSYESALFTCGSCSEPITDVTRPTKRRGR